MVLKRWSFNRILLLVMWGVKVCLATNGGRGEDPPHVSSGKGGVSPNTVQYDRKTVETAALSVLEECNNGPRRVCHYLLNFVRSRSLKPRLVRAAKEFREWGDKLEKSARIKKKSVNSECDSDEPPSDDEFSDGESSDDEVSDSEPSGGEYSDEESRHALTIPELNDCFKHVYNTCVGSFKDVLGELRGRMKSKDFFTGFENGKEKMAERSTGFKSLRDAMEWSHDAVELYSRYVGEALKVRALAREIRKDLLRYMKTNSRWRRLMDLKKNHLDNQSRFSREQFIGIASYNRQKINVLMLNYLTEYDKERWESLVRNVGPILKYEPSLLERPGLICSLDGLDCLLSHVMAYFKKRYAAEFQGDREVLFKEDLNFSRSLNKRMDLMLLENASNSGEIRISNAGKF